MDNNFRISIMRSLPNGKISYASAEEINRMVEECENDVEHMSGVASRAKRLIGMASTCYDVGYYYKARELYRRALDIIRGCNTPKMMRYRELFYTAARGIDKSMKKVSPQWGNYAYDRAVYYVMLSIDDYNYTTLGIDNDYSFNAVTKFKHEHNITNEDWLDF